MRRALVGRYVEGHPAPQGSKRHVGGGILIESSKRVKPWREAVRRVWRDAMPDGPFAGPVVVEAHFLIARPKHHYGTGKNAGAVRPSAAKAATSRSVGDLDKLLRSTLDSLTGIAYGDDSQVVVAHASKQYTAGKPGAYIEVSQYREHLDD